MREESITKSYFEVFLPTCISMVMYSLYCFADVFFVARGAGNLAIAAVNVALPAFTIFSSLGMLYGIGTSIVTAIYLGRRKIDKANRAFTLYVFLGIVTGAISFSIFGLFTKQIAILFGANSELLPVTVSYMRSILPCSFLSIFIYSLPIIVRADGNPRLAMVAGLAGNFTNIFLDYVFVMKCGMGAYGAGVATSIGGALSICLLLLHFALKKNTLKFSRKFLDKRLLKRICKNGFSSFVLELSQGSVILIVNAALIAVSGSTACSIYSVITNIAFIAKNMFSGAAQASQPIISKNYARGNMENVKKANKLCMIVTICISLVTVALLYVYGKNFLSVFLGTDANILARGQNAIYIYFSLFVFSGINTSIMYYFQSVEESLFATGISLLRGFVFPLVLLFVLPQFFSVYGVWALVPLSETLTFLCIYKKAKKLHKRVARKANVYKNNVE